MLISPLYLALPLCQLTRISLFFLPYSMGCRPPLLPRGAWANGTGGRFCVPACLVRFVGKMGGGALHALFKSCDAVVVPSRNEPFGIVVLEAWSASKPVVATNSGGPRDFVNPNITGILVVSLQPLSPIGLSLSAAGSWDSAASQQRGLKVTWRAHAVQV